MFSWLLYHCILIPLSWLPIGLLYFISNFIYSILYYIVNYRKAVVLQNLQNAFPDKSKKELKTIAKQFFKHLSNLLAESIKNLTISKRQLVRRMKVVNPELMDELYDSNQSVILLGSHMYNWEFLITAQNLLFKHQAIGIGTPLSNGILNEKINSRRGRFGMKVTYAADYKNVLEEHSLIPTATLVLGDQSPSNSNNAYWSDFLNQQTAFFFGAEIMANQTGAAVVYCKIDLAKKGYYQITLKKITSEPHHTKYGSITSQYIQLLEEDIHTSPPYWLWSHKRWKIQVPSNINELKKNHMIRFNDRFRNQ